MLRHSLQKNFLSLYYYKDGGGKNICFQIIRATRENEFSKLKWNT